MLARASPLNPIDLILCKSSNADNLDVVCLSHSIGRSSNYTQKENHQNAKITSHIGTKTTTFGNKGREGGGNETVTDSDSVAIVGDLDEFEAAVLDDEVDGGGGGVEAVLDQLLHGGDGALDDFPGGDSVDDGLAEAVDFGWVFWGMILLLLLLFDVHWG